LHSSSQDRKSQTGTPFARRTFDAGSACPCSRWSFA